MTACPAGKNDNSKRRDDPILRTVSPLFVTEHLFSVMLVLFLTAYLLDQIQWTDHGFARQIRDIGLLCNTVNLWLAAVYTAFLAVIRIRKPWAVLPAGVFVGAVMFLGKFMDFEHFQFFMTLFLALAAYKKDYRRILLCYLIVYLVQLVISLAGVPAGLTVDVLKVEKYGIGHSLGFIHPNVTAQSVFLVLVLLWYLYLKRKRFIAIGLFWAAAAVVYVLCQCRTITIFLAVFPVMAAQLPPSGEGTEPDRHGKSGRIAGIAAAASPFLFWGLSVVLSLCMDVIQRTRGLPFYNMMGRFVQTGIALKKYGFHFLGQKIDCSGRVMMHVNGKTEVLHVLDNAYVTYTIQEGLLFMLPLLGWLSLAAGLCFRKRNDRLLLISLFMLIYALMERGGLLGYYNPLFLYPMTVISQFFCNSDKQIDTI